MALENLLIGDLSGRTGVSVRTIRYYEQEGLLAPAGRRPSGYRLYTERDAEKLRFIRQAKNFGLTLKEIRSIMRCSRQGLQPCCDLVRQLFNRKITELEGKISELTQTRDRLRERLRRWVGPREAGRRGYAVCPQIESTKPPKSGRRKR
jgi:MerR family Zn(II)-responsive transcriptional regulator of zntA